MIPFGALVRFKETGGRTFEPKGVPALYLGAELIGGLKHKGNHKVLPLDHLLKGSLKVRVVRTLAFPNGKWQFPLKAAGSSEGQVQQDDFTLPPAGNHQGRRW